MTVREIIKFIEKWAPSGVAWEKDNVGLQIGDENQNVDKVLLSLDLTYQVVEQAIKQKANLIFTHHPFFFYPIKNINYTSNQKSQIIKKLLENNISVYSAHTNLDFTKGGVSFKIAEKLGLKNIHFLKNDETTLYKVVVFVPEKDIEKLRNSIFEVGGGIIGEYEKCSFNSEGIGTFEGSENSKPTIGIKENFEKVNEIRLEVRVEKWNLKSVISAIKKVHPYEEPVYDIYETKNSNENYGIGAIGELEKSLSINQFLDLTKQNLNLKNFRYTKGKSRRIKSVAVCGGSCSSELKTAITQKADAYITADISYHTFQEAENKILFIDAGHYETEIHIMDEVKKRLTDFTKLKNEKVEIVKYTGSTNPISFYK